MKKTILLIVGLISISAICFAEEKEPVPAKPAAKEEKAAPVQAKSGTFSGKVQLVTMADTDAGIQPEFIVMTDGGQLMGFQVEPGSSAAKMLGSIKAGNKVKVDYEIKPPRGITAVSIKPE